MPHRRWLLQQLFGCKLTWNIQWVPPLPPGSGGSPVWGTGNELQWITSLLMAWRRPSDTSKIKIRKLNTRKRKIRGWTPPAAQPSVTVAISSINIYIRVHGCAHMYLFIIFLFNWCVNTEFLSSCTYLQFPLLYRHKIKYAVFIRTTTNLHQTQVRVCVFVFLFCFSVCIFCCSCICLVYYHPSLLHPNADKECCPITSQVQQVWSCSRFHV